MKPIDMFRDGTGLPPVGTKVKFKRYSYTEPEQIGYIKPLLNNGSWRFGISLYPSCAQAVYWDSVVWFAPCKKKLTEYKP